MNKFGLHTFGLPSFGISDFRLTSFGGDGDGGRKAAFHNSLVDAWFMSGYSNSDKPKEIVGVRGNAIELNNFLYAKNSGFGKYAEDFMSRFYLGTTLVTVKEKTTSSITISKLIKGRGTFELRLDGGWAPYNFKGYSIKVEGYPPNVDRIEFYCSVSDGGESQTVAIKGDGIYTLNDHVYQKQSETSLFYHGLVFNTLADVDCNLTITQIPENEGSLCFDGVDDYGRCVGLPLLEDYTVICRREYFKNEGTSCLLSKDSTGSNIDGAFMIERTPTATMSYTKGNSISRDPSNMVIYQTKTSYNGTPLTVGNAVDSDRLNLGCVTPSMGFFNGSIYYFALYNKSLSTQEIEEEKIKLEQKWNSKLK